MRVSPVKKLMEFRRAGESFLVLDPGPLAFEQLVRAGLGITGAFAGLPGLFVIGIEPGVPVLVGLLQTTQHLCGDTAALFHATIEARSQLIFFGHGRGRQKEQGQTAKQKTQFRHG